MFYFFRPGYLSSWLAGCSLDFTKKSQDGKRYQLLLESKGQKPLNATWVTCLLRDYEAHHDPLDSHFQVSSQWVVEMVPIKGGIGSI